MILDRYKLLDNSNDDDDDDDVLTPYAHQHFTSFI